MDKLGVLRADLEPRATENVDAIIAMCKKLVDLGKAYATPNGDVYFRVRSGEHYGSLSGRSLDETDGRRQGCSLASKRKIPGFRALEKAQKPGEPEWESPWGMGRPGWHIECSAMTEPYLPLDIHGGGQDLIFPHHENEAAQSEAACGCKACQLLGA